jgi:hypothetical protein
MGKLLVKFRERSLLINSKVIEDYPHLKELINNTPNMKKSQLDTLQHEMQVFFDNMFPKILKQAAEEWSGDSHHPIDILDDDNIIRCQLCNHKIKYVCYIVNKLNGNRLEVGRECVKHFGLFSDIPIEELFKEMARIKKIEEFNLLIPGIEKVISTWDGKLDSYPILIPKRMKSPYLALGRRANELFQEFVGKHEITEDSKKEIICQIDEILKKREALLSNIEKYVAEEKYQKYVPTREIVNWLKRKGSNDANTALDWLEEDGMVTWRTIFRIEEPSFMKSVIKDLNEHLTKIGLRVEKVDINVNAYTLVSSKRPKIKLFCKHRKLMLDYGGLLFGKDIDKKLTLGNVVQMSTIYREESTIDAFIDTISALINKSDIEFKENFYDFGEVIVYEKKANKYIFVKHLFSFIDKFKGLPFEVGNETVEDLVKYVTMPHNTRYNSTDIKEIRKAR